jgi:hypothetical protein
MCILLTFCKEFDKWLVYLFNDGWVSFVDYKHILRIFKADVIAIYSDDIWIY